MILTTRAPIQHFIISLNICIMKFNLLFLCKANDEIKEESKGYQWESIGLYCRH
jgi:hypothetical protein